MGINVAIYSRLSNYTDLTDLVSTRIYRLQAPHTTSFPYVTFGRVANEIIHAMGSDPGLEGPSFQVDVWAENTNSMENVSTEVKAALQDYSGTVSGIVIQRIFFDNEIDLSDEDTSILRIIYHNAMDFKVWYEV